jgi:hypothetical protein
MHISFSLCLYCYYSQCNNFISITKYQRNYQTTLEELAKKMT